MLLYMLKECLQKDIKNKLIKTDLFCSYPAAYFYFWNLALHTSLFKIMLKGRGPLFILCLKQNILASFKLSIF